MKKTLLFIAVFVLIFTLSGCSKEQELECYDETYSITMKYNKEEIISILEVDFGEEYIYTEQQVDQTQTKLEEFYQGDNLEDILDAFMEDAEDMGATCNTK